MALTQLSYGDLVSAGSNLDPTIKIWNLKTRELIQTIITGHTDSIFALNISLDRQMLASASADKTVRIWSILNEIKSKQTTS